MIPDQLPINTSHVDEFFKPLNPEHLKVDLQEEMTISEEWAIGEECLSDKEAERWMVSDPTPTLAAGLSLFEEAAVYEVQAMEHNIKATKLCEEAELVRKRRLKVMLAASQAPLEPVPSAPSTSITMSSSTSAHSQELHNECLSCYTS